MRHLGFLSLLTLALPLLADFRVIAHPSVSGGTLTKAAVADLFLKNKVKWPDGGTVVPVDQVVTSPVRAAFSNAILGRKAYAVRSFWNQQIFSGRGIPPVEMTTDAEVLLFVRSTPGAVAYVSDGASTTGVRVLKIE